MTSPSSFRTGSNLEERLRGVLEGIPEVRLALLFGSQARGTARTGSDVDVAVLAHGADLLALAAALSRAIGETVDVVSLEDPGFPLLEELVRDSIPVYEGTPGAAASWRAHALSELDLDRPGFERMRDAWLARVAREGL
jgi:predicted nucleotidyltransferase